MWKRDLVYYTFSRNGFQTSEVSIISFYKLEGVGCSIFVNLLDGETGMHEHIIVYPGLPPASEEDLLRGARHKHQPWQSYHLWLQSSMVWQYTC